MKRDLSKSVIRGVKFSLLSYAIISIVYTALQLYNSRELPAVAFNSKRSLIQSLPDTAEYMQDSYQEGISFKNDETLIESLQKDIFDIDDDEALYHFDTIMTNQPLDNQKNTAEEMVDLYIGMSQALSMISSTKELQLI